MKLKRGSAMKLNVLCIHAGVILVTPSLVAQTSVAASPAIPEEARRHFVMGETMFKEAKSAENFSQAAEEFTEATQLAPQWPDARYDLALAKEAAGDYSGAIVDLKLYQQFKLTDVEARTVQDKIYAIEAKQKMTLDAANSPAAQLEKFLKSLDGGVWRVARDSGNNMGTPWADDDALGLCYLAVKGNKIGYNFYIVNADGSPGVATHVRHYNYDPNIPPEWTATLIGKTFSGPINQALVTGSYEHFTISDNGQTITEEARYIYPSGSATATKTFERIK